MTERQAEVYEALVKVFKDKERPVTPTEVGESLGVEYGTASPYCTNGINKAIKLGLVERVSRGQYIPVKEDENGKES